MLSLLHHCFNVFRSWLWMFALLRGPDGCVEWVEWFPSWQMLMSPSCFVIIHPTGELHRLAMLSPLSPFL